MSSHRFVTALALLAPLCALAAACAGPSAPGAPAPAVARQALEGDPGDPFLLTAPDTATGTLAANASHTYRVTVPAGHAGLRVAVSATGGNVDLLLRRDDPVSGSLVAAEYDRDVLTVFRTPEETVADDLWYVEVRARDAAADYSLAVDARYAEQLVWDTGAALLGDAPVTRATAGGDYLFAVTAQNSAYCAWHTVLRVESGDADLYMAPSSFPADWVGNRSTDPGSDAVLLAANQYGANDTWLVRVHVHHGGATWSLLSGDVHVVDLGALPTAPAPLTVEPDVFGLAFAKTSVPAEALAWRLAAYGHALAIDKLQVPLPDRPGTYDWKADDHLLVVPPLLSAEQFFVTVTASQPFTLDSAQQAIHDAPGDGFAFTVDDADDDGFGYVTYRVVVPVSQIAWQVKVAPVSGECDVYVKRLAVPAEYDNGGFSEAPAGDDSITQVPPSLSDGTWYVTVRGTPPFSFRLTSGNPVVTDIPFVTEGVGSGHVDNGAGFESLVGWRFFRVPDIVSQVGSLGWILDLAGHVPGTEIALRKNAVPGRWSYRTFQGADYPGYVQEHAHVDLSSTTGFLERP
ncbi:MAG: hypothetical protein KC635_10850, partial [Myxococcales bacterium]|nr:hypothetical protein [Myxococcales bacterium]